MFCRRYLMLLLLITLPLQASASWILDTDNSQLFFSFTKSTHLTTTANFAKLTGSISDNRVARVSIQLDSLNSGIEKRDTRLRDLFFQTKAHPSADVEIRLYDRILKKIEKQQHSTLNISFYLTLNGERKRMNADVYINLDENKNIHVVTVKPIMVHANEFGLTDKVEALVKLAGVNTISYTVPVTFQLKFSPEKKP